MHLCGQQSAWCWHVNSGATVHHDTWLSGFEHEAVDDFSLPAYVTVVVDCEKGTMDIARNGTLLVVIDAPLLARLQHHRDAVSQLPLQSLH